MRINSLLAVLLIVWHGANGATPSDLLEKGIYTEETKGDLKEAIQLYQEIVYDPGADPGLIAQAQLRLGLCHLKLGNKSKAVSALESLTREFPDKEKLLALVEKQMPLLLDEIVLQIEQNYIKELDRKDLMNTAIQAIIGKLDKQSDFLSENELVQIDRQLEQKVAGIGARLKLDKETSEIVVETPLPGSPAFKGGIRPGDRIAEIDGQLVGNFPPGKELENGIKLIQGTPGTSLVLGVKHAGSEEVTELKLVRGTIRLPTVLGDHLRPDQSWEFMLEEERKIGYIRLTDTGRRSPEEMQTALIGLTNRGMKALVLDLRNNPGGLLTETTEICDLFIESGTIVSIKGRTDKEHVYSATPEGTFGGFPMAVLVNSNTASASEIIAACLQDHQRAVIVGERTFGQGLVKSLIKLEGGKSALKLPTSAFYRPNGKNIHRYPESREEEDWGVRPDPNYEVVLSIEERKALEKQWRDRDVLDGLPRGAIRDRQLEKALEYLLPQVATK